MSQKLEFELGNSGANDLDPSVEVMFAVRDPVAILCGRGLSLIHHALCSSISK